MEFQVAYQSKRYFWKLLIAQFGANFVYFKKNAPHFKKNRQW